QLARHDLFQTVYAGNAITYGNYAAHLGNIDGAFVVFDLLTQNAGYLVCSYLSHKSFRLAFRAEPPAQHFELTSHAAVVDCGADACSYPADQRIIHAEAGADALAADALEVGAQHFALCIAERQGAVDLRTDEAHAFIGDDLETMDDFAEQGNAALI